MNSYNIKSFLITILLFFYSLNFLIEITEFNYFYEILLPTRLIFIAVNILIFFFLRNFLKVNGSKTKIELFSIIFFLFAVFNYKDVSTDYFWKSIPDSRTYLALGQNLFECFRLTMSCESGTHLEFAIGQPIISGLLSKYFYNYSFVISILMITFVIHTISDISYKKYKTTSGLGLFYLLSHSLIYELTPMMISEVSFTFLIFVFLKLFFSKNKQKYNLMPVVYAFSILVRPVGIALLPIFGFIFRRRVYTYLILLLILFFAAGFNYFTADQFTISDFNLDSRQDGMFENTGYIDYFFDLAFSDYNTKSNFIDFIKENYSRLYGKSSKDCNFNETCFFYNPKYNEDGTVPQFFMNSNLGKIFNKFLELFYNLRSPQGIGLIVLPLTMLIPFISKKFSAERLLSLSIFLLIIPSIITTEFGNRWNFTILFISSLIIEMTTSSMIYKQNK